MGDPSGKSDASAAGDQVAEIEVEPSSHIADMGLDMFSDVATVPLPDTNQLKVAETKGEIMAAENPTKALGSIRDLAKKRLKSMKFQKQYQAEVAANSKTKDVPKKKSKKPPKPEKEEVTVHRPSTQLLVLETIQLYDDDEVDTTSECPNTPELPSDNALEQKLEEKLNELKNLEGKSDVTSGVTDPTTNRKRRASDEKKLSAVPAPKRDRKRSETPPGPNSELEPGELTSPKSEQTDESPIFVKEIKAPEQPERKRRRTSSMHSEKSKKSKKTEKSSKKKRSDRKKSRKQSSSKKQKSKDKKREKDSGKDRKDKRESTRRERSSDRRSKSTHSKSDRGRLPMHQKRAAEVPARFLRFTLCHPVISFSENPKFFVEAPKSNSSSSKAKEAPPTKPIQMLEKSDKVENVRIESKIQHNRNEKKIVVEELVVKPKVETPKGKKLDEKMSSEKPLKPKVEIKLGEHELDYAVFETKTKKEISPPVLEAIPLKLDKWVKKSADTKARTDHGHRVDKKEDPPKGKEKPISPLAAKMEANSRNPMPEDNESTASKPKPPFVCSFLSDWDQSKDQIFSSINTPPNKNDKRGASSEDNENDSPKRPDSPDTDEYVSNWEDEDSSFPDVSYEKAGKVKKPVGVKTDKLPNYECIETIILTTPSPPPSVASVGLSLNDVLTTPKKLQDLFELVDDDVAVIKEQVKKLVEAEKRVHESPKSKAPPASKISKESVALPKPESEKATPDGGAKKKESKSVVETANDVEIVCVTPVIAPLPPVAKVVVATKPEPIIEKLEEKLADEYESFMKAVNDSSEKLDPEAEQLFHPKLDSDKCPVVEIKSKGPSDMDNDSSNDSSSDSDDSSSSSTSSSSSSSSTSSSASSTASLSLAQPIRSDRMTKSGKTFEQFIADCKNNSSDVNKQTIAVVKPLQSATSLVSASEFSLSSYDELTAGLLVAQMVESQKSLPVNVYAKPTNQPADTTEVPSKQAPRKKSRDRSPLGRNDRTKIGSRSRRERSPAKKTDRYRRSSRSPRRNSKDRYSSRRSGQRSPKRRRSREKSPRRRDSSPGFRRPGRDKHFSVSPSRNSRKRTISPSFRGDRGERSPRYWSRSPQRHKRVGSHSPVNFKRSRSRSRDRFRRSWSRSPLPFRPRSPDENWNGRWEGDYYRPPSPKESQSKVFDSPQIESPVAGYKKSIADSTISDAELEKQRRMAHSFVFNPETNSWVQLEPMDYGGNPLSPKRISLDERINMVLGSENNYSPSHRPMEGEHHHHQHPHHHGSHEAYYPPGGGGYEHRPPDFYGYDYNQQQQHQAQQQQQQQQHFNQQPGYGQHQSNYQKSFHHNRSNLVDVYNNQQSSSTASTSTPSTSKPFAVQKGNVLEIVPLKLTDKGGADGTKTSEPSADFDVKREKVKRVLSKEEMEQKLERKADAKRKRKQDREKKRVEKKMRKEKIKIEMRRLVSMGVTIEEEVLFDIEETELVKKVPLPAAATIEKTILRTAATSQVTTVKKRVSFADGLAPGDGSSCSDNEDGASPITAVMAKKQKKILKKKNKKQKQDKDKENRATAPTKQKGLEQTIIDPELENAPPPPPPPGSPLMGFIQPRLRVPPPSQYIYFQHVMPFRPAPADHHNHHQGNSVNSPAQPPPQPVQPPLAPQHQQLQQIQQQHPLHQHVASPKVAASPQINEAKLPQIMKPAPNPPPHQQQHFQPPPNSGPPMPVQPPLPPRPVNMHHQHSQPPPPINYQVPPPHGPPTRFLHNHMMPMQAPVQHNMYNKAQPRFMHNQAPPPHFQHPMQPTYPIVMGPNPNLVMVSGGMQPQHNMYGHGQNMQYENMGLVPAGHYPPPPPQHHPMAPQHLQYYPHHVNPGELVAMQPSSSI